MRTSKPALIATTVARIHRCSSWTPCVTHNMGGHTATLNDHLRGHCDDDDDGTDEDVAQTTDQTPPQDTAITSEPGTRS